MLKNRNALLQAACPADRMLLDTYDDELARTGARVVMRRRALVGALAPRLAEHFRALHSELPVSLVYRSEATVDAAATDEDGGRARRCARGLVARRALDERRRFTGFGPHADDLEIGLAGSLARSHASQGQLRSLVLALKLAELTNVEARLGEPPVLLLDDVPSELDPVRRALLFEVIAQARLPDAHLRHRARDRLGVPAARSDRKDFLVRAGRVIRDSVTQAPFTYRQQHAR